PPPPPPPLPRLPRAPRPAAGAVAVGGTALDRGVTGYPGLPSWQVQLTGTVTATVVTDAGGHYAFTGLPAGTYTICEVVQSAWSQTFPPVGTAGLTGVGSTVSLSDGPSGPWVDFGDPSIP